jgi:energy-coupling factor transporter ATP-binding protein EcfA2
MTSSSFIFRVRDASVEYDLTPVLNGVGLEVHPGEIVAIMGANGSGKSTLMRALLGIVPLTNGTVEINGTPLRDFRDWARIGYVPQRLGVALVVIGFVASSIAWANYQVLLSFAILFLTAFIDLVLYIVMGESLTCYRCHAQYRGVEQIEQHGGFDLETHERYRQLAARMKDQSTGSATASIPN